MGHYMDSVSDIVESDTPNGRYLTEVRAERDALFQALARVNGEEYANRILRQTRARFVRARKEAL